MLKKILIFTFLLSLYNIGNAIDFSYLSNKETSCSGANKNMGVYIENGVSYTATVHDEFWHPKDRYIANSGTTVKLWMSDNSLVSGCNSSSDWLKISDIAPGNNEKVVAISSRCTFNKPTNINNRTLQFTFNINHGEISGGGTDNPTRYYYPFSGWYNSPVTKVSKTYNNYLVSNYVLDSTECLNVTLSWCGDGTKDTQETCDPNDVATKTGWGAGGCDASCKPITNNTPSCVNGGTTGKQSSPVQPDNSNLCQAGVSASNFLADSNGIVATYTWSCGGISGCSATYDWPSGGTPPVCNSLTADTYTTTASSLTNNIRCEGNFKVDRFRIDCGNGATVTTVNATSAKDSSGTDIKVGTGVCNYTNSPSSSYTPKCSVGYDGADANYYPSASCQNTVSLTPGGGPSCPGCGSSSLCNRILINENSTGSRTETSTGLFTKTITCEGAGSNYTVDCGNSTFPSTTQVSPGRWNATCTYNALGKYNYTASCKANGQSTPSAPCITSLTMGGPSYCGDGVLQRPNSYGQNEDCEKDSSGNWPSYCDTGCQIKTFTIPHGAGLELGPIDDIVIGDGVNPYEYIGGGIGYGVKPYIYNNSSYEVYFDQMCVQKTGLALTGPDEICNTLGHIYPGDKKIMNVPDFKGNKNAIPTGSSYSDNTIKTTIKHNGLYYFDPAKLNVRVAKPSVITTGGGTSYIKSNSKIANIESVSSGKTKLSTDNKNFIGASVSNSNISSYSKSTSDATKVITDSTKYKASVGKIINNTPIFTNPSSSNFSDFGKYNGLSNVFIIKNKDFTINGTVPGTGPITYIIENGNLIINSDINYVDNIAFVVKGGNIIIKNIVKSINGTYITIGGVSGGYIKGDGIKTKTQLQVNGSLYGDVNGLVDERTYIDENDNRQLDVGTIVSFGSSIFRKTAPLTGQFIGEYLQSKKVSH